MTLFLFGNEELNLNKWKIRGMEEQNIKKKQ